MFKLIKIFGNDNVKQNSVRPPVFHPDPPRNAFLKPTHCGCGIMDENHII